MRNEIFTNEELVHIDLRLKDLESFKKEYRDIDNFESSYCPLEYLLKKTNAMINLILDFYNEPDHKEYYLLMMEHVLPAYLDFRKEIKELLSRVYKYHEVHNSY